MTIEEKAKAYDKALERAKEYYDVDEDNTMQVHARGVMEYLFPELKESEDEKIKKAIRYAISQSTHSDGTLINEISSEEAFDWLEKQGEQKPVFIPKFKVGDVVTFDGYRDKSTIAEIDFDNKWYNIAEDKTRCILFSEQDNWKLVEQTPADWSEEDENCLYMAIECVKTCGYPNIANWLKSLRPQPKQDHFK